MILYPREIRIFDNCSLPTIAIHIDVSNTVSPDNRDQNEKHLSLLRKHALCIEFTASIAFTSNANFEILICISLYRRDLIQSKQSFICLSNSIISNVH